ncbi:MAG: ABC transporter substrate-binding protein, partial [Hyphomicrobiales bacterium]
AAISFGCGGDDDSDDSPGPGTGSTITAPPTASGEAKKGGTLNMIWAVADAQLDPHTSVEHLSAEIYRAASHGLLKQEAGTEKPIPDLATEWETPDPTTLIFHLNPAAKWQNLPPVNGRPVTADDVVYSLKRIGTPGPAAPRASSFSAIEDVIATDEHTVTIKLKEPFVPILAALSDKWTVMVAPEVVEQNGDLKRGDIVVGCGPFICEQAESSKGVTFVRNPDYWGTPAHLDKVIYTTITDAEARVAAFQSGQADISDPIPALLLNDFKKDDVDIYDFPPVSLSYGVIGGPLDRPPLNDERARRALHLAVDRQQLGEILYPGAKFSIAGALPHAAWGLPEAEVAKIPGFGPGVTDDQIKEARQLLSSAGLEGAELVINTTRTYAVHHSDRAEALVPMLEKVGFAPRLNVLEYAVFKDLEAKRDFQVTVATYAAYGDPNTPLANSFTTGATRNYWGWSDSKYDEMIKAQQQEMDPAKRLEMIHEIERYLLNGTPVAFDNWYMVTNVAARKKVKNYQGGYSAGSACTGWFLPQIWLDA